MTVKWIHYYDEQEIRYESSSFDQIELKFFINNDIFGVQSIVVIEFIFNRPNKLYKRTKRNNFSLYVNAIT